MSLPPQSLREFNPRPNRIHDKRDLQIQIRHLAIRSFHSNPLGLKILHERLKVHHFKTDVIDHAALRCSWSRRTRREEEIDFVTVEHRGGKIPARCTLCPKSFHIPPAQHFHIER